VLPAEPTWPKLLVAAVLLAVYAWYVKGHFEADPSVDAEDLAPLRFHRFDAGRTTTPDGGPRLRIINMQVAVALGLIVLGAIAFLASAAIFLPMARSGRLRGRGLLVGGAFYVAYLIIVGIGISSG